MARPLESLNVEIKNWISPDEPLGIAKIVKAVQAIRNRNGGFLLIGFNDVTLLPDSDRPSNVKPLFHSDKIQAIVSKYSAQQFEIAVGFGSRDGADYPVIIIPDGVLAPVAAARDFLDSSQNTLIKKGDVYFRTLQSNGTPSTARAQPNDWPEIMEIRFQNREADIGRFFRRHLAGNQIEALLQVLTDVKATVPPSLLNQAQALLNDGNRRLNEALAARTLTSDEKKIVNGLAWEIGLVVTPVKTPALPDQNFLNAVAASNPRLTGWPVWLDSRNFEDRSAAPRVIERAWQALIFSCKSWYGHADFMRLDPKGAFYLWRVMPDDLSPNISPGTVLDPILVVGRVTEALAVGLRIVKGLGWAEDLRLGFAFRWTKLSNRELSSWANPMVHVTGGHTAYDDVVESFVELALDTPISAIAPYVEQATRDLFLAFDGYTLPQNAAEYWVEAVLKRQW